MKQSYTSH